jgi:hypothetical protein
MMTFSGHPLPYERTFPTNLPRRSEIDPGPHQQYINLTVGPETLNITEY